MLTKLVVMTFCAFPTTPSRKSATLSFFGSYGFGKWAAVALGVRVIEVSSESPNKAPRLKQEINQHREMHPNQPLAIVAMSNDIDHHYEAYVLIDQPEFALPSWLADALVKRRSSLMAWLLTQPRNDDNTTDYHERQIDSLVAWQLTENGDGKEFLVRWVGWKEPTWEPEDNVPKALVNALLHV